MKVTLCEALGGIEWKIIIGSHALRTVARSRCSQQANKPNSNWNHLKQATR